MALAEHSGEVADDDADLVRYWFEFDLTGLEPPPPQPGKFFLHRYDGPVYSLCSQGVGVTGFDEDDCLQLVARVLAPDALPPLRSSIRDVNVSDLDLEPQWVGPPVVPVWRGVWFPRLSDFGPVLR